MVNVWGLAQVNETKFVKGVKIKSTKQINKIMVKLYFMAMWRWNPIMIKAT